MRKIIDFTNKPYFVSWAAVGGYEEGNGPLGACFDHIDNGDRFGKESWEKAEGEMGRIALNCAIKKSATDMRLLDVLLAGDLENQCVASASGLMSFGIPYLGLYSACSTSAEALLLLSSLLSFTDMKYGAAVTTSHNSAAERQFRSPIEYGGQRTPTSQWTATAAGAFILSTENRKSGIYIDNAMVGKMVDGLTTDGSNMGAAMARAAFDSIYTYFSLCSLSPSDFDLIVTGDLGKIGSEVLCELLSREVPGAENKHVDCGTLLYDMKKSGVNSGASGCGCSASVLAGHFLPLLGKGRLKSILFLATGALMNPTSVLQGENIIGIAPIVNIKSEVSENGNIK